MAKGLAFILPLEEHAEMLYVLQSDPTCYPTLLAEYHKLKEEVGLATPCLQSGRMKRSQ